MIKLSVNVNKIATLRNARGGDLPCLIQVVKDLIDWGVLSITVHPRPDGRHIRYQDVKQIGALIHHLPNQVELNVEGYPSDVFLNLIQEVKPHQCTLVPDPPQALTSDKGWDFVTHFKQLKAVLHFLKKNQVRSSLFLDPILFKKEQMSDLIALSPDRVEFYTGTFAKQWSSNGSVKKILDTYQKVALWIHEKGIGINAGHDLNQNNLGDIIQSIPFLKEVSIGHALICEALYGGLRATVDQYFQLIRKGVEK